MMDDFFDRFLAFCDSKPPEERYNPADAEKCAIGQFGISHVNAGNCEDKGIPRALYTKIVYAGEPYFGPLVERLKEWRKNHG